MCREGHKCPTVNTPKPASTTEVGSWRDTPASLPQGEMILRSTPQVLSKGPPSAGALGMYCVTQHRQLYTCTGFPSISVSLSFNITVLLGITSQVSHWVFVSGFALERTQPKTPPHLVWRRLQEDAHQAFGTVNTLMASNLSCHREYILRVVWGLTMGLFYILGLYIP